MWSCSKLEEEVEGKNKNTGVYLVILVSTVYENIYKVFTLFKVLKSVRLYVKLTLLTVNAQVLLGHW